MTWVLVTVAGGVGTALRYALHLLTVSVAGPNAPWGTFAANVIGSFALGLLFELGAGRTVFGVDARLVLGTGLLGGFTTYSTFNLETLRMWNESTPTRAALYVLATVVTCLLAGAAGLTLARTLRPTV